MVAIHEKIVHLLEVRRLRRRDLAQSLGVSPQTATDICKGRSAVTLSHLRALVRMFDLRPDYWLDDARLEPGPVDRIDATRRLRVEALERSGVLSHRDPVALFRRLQAFAMAHSAAFRAANPDLTPEDLNHLDLPDAGSGRVGRVSN